MGGEELWEKTGHIPPLPPSILKKKMGRPQRQRRKSAGESPKKKGHKKISSNQTMPKQKFKVKCKYCGDVGHNRLGCETRKKDVAAKINENVETSKINENAETSKINENATTSNINEKYEISCTFCYEVGHNRHNCELRKTMEAEIEAENLVQEPEVKEMTQPDYPNATQDEEECVTEPKRKKPTTRKGRRVLASKRKNVVAGNKTNESSNEVRPLPTTYSIANSLQRIYGTNIQITGTKEGAHSALRKLFWPPRPANAPAPAQSMNAHQQVQSSSLDGDADGSRVFTTGGKMFTNLSSLKAAASKKRGAKN